MDTNHESSNSNVITDGCPAWAEDLIRRIYLLEIESGAIKNPESDQWSTTTQDQLLKLADRMENSVGSDVGEEVDAMFERVARGLAAEKFEPEAISQMINVRIPTGCKLNYCSPSEVLAILH